MNQSINTIVIIVLMTLTIAVPLSLKQPLRLSDKTVINLNYFLIVLLLIGIVLRDFKKKNRLTKKYWRSVIKNIKEIIIVFSNFIKAFSWLIGIIIAIIVGGILLSNFIGAIGTIPFLLITLIFVVGSRLERIEEELRELRNSREDKFYNDYDEF